jgi:endonuclease III
MTTPDPRRIRAVQRRLRRRQGAFVPKPRLPIIDEVVATVLSQHTSCDMSTRREVSPGQARWLTDSTLGDAPKLNVL